MALNWDIIESKWSQFRGKARRQWGKLTDDDWDRVAGQRDKLAGRLQEHYGWTREEAEREMEFVLQVAMIANQTSGGGLSGALSVPSSLSMLLSVVL